MRFMVSSDEIRRRLEAKRRGLDVPEDKQVEQSTVTCSECQTSNPAGAKFCVGCGAQLVKEEPIETPAVEPVSQVQTTTPSIKTSEAQELEDYKTCPSCNQKNKPDAKFCIICGHKFEEKNGEGIVKPKTMTEEEGFPSAHEVLEPSSEEPPEAVTEESPKARSDEPQLDTESAAVPEIKVPEHLKPVGGSDTGSTDQMVDVEELEDVSEDVSVKSEPKMEQKKTPGSTEDVDPVEKIKKAKELLDIGAITQEEFDRIKNKYLELL